MSPILKLVAAFGGFANAFPVEARRDARERCITALAPKSIERSIFGDAGRVAVGADYAAKGGMRCAMRARLRLALVEEGVAYALAAMARKQDRLTEIESASNVETRGGERLLPCRVLRGERRRGGCADNIFAEIGRASCRESVGQYV